MKTNLFLFNNLSDSFESAAVANEEELIKCIIKDHKSVGNQKTWDQVSVFLIIKFWTTATQFPQICIRDNHYFVGFL